MKAYLSVCSMYRNHAEYLREWIEFHRLVGVERFFLYDNESTDGHEEILRPYVEKDIVVIHDWPTPASVERGVPWGLIAAFDDCLEKHRGETRWLAFLDIDEFLFSPTGKPLPELLTRYESYPGVCVNRVDFGMGGHDDKPPGLVIENYLRRRRYLGQAVAHIKSIVDPARVERCFNAHWFHYLDGAAPVDENEQPIVGVEGRPSKTKPSLSRLRINHYPVKSKEEFRVKYDKWEEALARGGQEGGPEWQTALSYAKHLDREFDDTITAYAPALREVLRTK